MSKAAIAVPYIIALVIGLIILAVMVYLFLRASGSGKLSTEECRSRFIEWCGMCSNLRWSPSLSLPQNLVDDCRDVLYRHLSFNISEYGNCGEEDAKKDCCTVGVKNEFCP